MRLLPGLISTLTLDNNYFFTNAILLHNHKIKQKYMQLKLTQKLKISQYNTYKIMLVVTKCHVAGYVSFATVRHLRCYYSALSTLRIAYM